MNYSLRESFVDIFHNKNLLEDFAKEIHLQVNKTKRDKIPPVPEKGTLDVSKVLQSLYFCS
jgi:DNA-directed RNA polymerase